MRIIHTPAAILTLTLSTLAFAGDLPDDKMPRYSLPVGREIVYTDTFAYTGSIGDFQKDGVWEILVARDNPDGSKHLILRRERMVTVAGNTTQEKEAETLGCADIFTDGRVSPHIKFGLQSEVYSLFPQLPKDQNELDTGWSFETPQTLYYRNFSKSTGDFDEFAFEFANTGPLPTIQQMTTTGKVGFDPKKGLTARVGLTEERTASPPSRLTEELTLKSDTMITPQEAERMGREFDTLFAAQEAYQGKLYTADLHPLQSEQIFASARADYLRLSGSFSMDLIRSRFQMMAASYQFVEAEERAGIQRMLPLLDKPAKTFNALDYDGQKHQSSDYRGKVLVLVSWHRGCGACVSLMPQVKQLVDDFQGQSVAVLGVNGGDDKASATTVIEAMKLNYPTLHLSPDKFYELITFGEPYTLVIDQNGILRAFHFGYIPNWRPEIGKAVQSLLDQSPSASAVP